MTNQEPLGCASPQHIGLQTPGKPNRKPEDMSVTALPTGGLNAPMGPVGLRVVGVARLTHPTYIKLKLGSQPSFPVWNRQALR